MAKVHGGNLHHIYADGCIPERQHFERSKKVVLPNQEWLRGPIKGGWLEQSQVTKGKFDSLICIFYVNGIR